MNRPEVLLIGLYAIGAAGGHEALGLGRPVLFDRFLGIVPQIGQQLRALRLGQGAGVTVERRQGGRFPLDDILGRGVVGIDAHRHQAQQDAVEDREARDVQGHHFIGFVLPVNPFVEQGPNKKHAGKAERRRPEGEQTAHCPSGIGIHPGKHSADPPRTSVDLPLGPRRLPSAIVSAPPNICGVAATSPKHRADDAKAHNHHRPGGRFGCRERRKGPEAIVGGQCGRRRRRNRRRRIVLRLGIGPGLRGYDESGEQDLRRIDYVVQTVRQSAREGDEAAPMDVPWRARDGDDTHDPVNAHLVLPRCQFRGGDRYGKAARVTG